MEEIGNSIVCWIYQHQEQIMTLVTGILVAIIAPLVGLIIYFKQKQYELVRNRYLDNGVDVLLAHVEYALGIFRHNWARSLNVLKHFREMGADIPPDLYKSGFLELEPVAYKTAHTFFLKEITGSDNFPNVLQLLFSFVHNSNALFIYDLCSVVRISVEGSTETKLNTPKSEIVEGYFTKLEELNSECNKFYIFQSVLHDISRALSREHFSFKTIEEFRNHKVVKESIETLEKEFGKELTEYSSIKNS